MDRGMEMGEDGEPSGATPLREAGASGDSAAGWDSNQAAQALANQLETARDLIIKLRYMVNMGCSHGETMKRVDAFLMARSAPEAASAEGSPSHPSGPSQDSQEVSEAIETLRGFAKRWCDDGQCRNINGYSHDPECRDFYNAIDAVEAVLSQSPKGAAGAADAFALGQVVDHATERAEKAEAVIRNYRKATFAALKALDEAVKVQLQQALCVDSDYCTEREEAKAAGGESGPSAPKTGLRGAPRQEEKDFSPQWTCMGCGNMERGTFRTIEHRGDPAEPVDYDLECTKCGNLDIAESPEEALSRLTTDCDTLRAENETLKAAKPPLSPKGEGSLPSSPSSPEAAEGGAT